MRYATLMPLLAGIGGLVLILWAFRRWLDGFDLPADPAWRDYAAGRRDEQQGRHTRAR